MSIHELAQQGKHNTYNSMASGIASRVLDIRKEIIREELHLMIKKGFGTNLVCSEYGMTELLSQAYSKKNGIFKCPPWMKILIREPQDAFSFKNIFYFSLSKLSDRNNVVL